MAEMGNVIDIHRARRRLGQRPRLTQRPWWRLWFWPPESTPEKLQRLSPEELRRGGIWGPAVDRGRQSGADLRLICPPTD